MDAQSKYTAVQSAIDLAIEEIYNLDDQEQPGWLSYLLEAIEKKDNVSVIWTMERMIQDRYANDGW